MVVKQKQGIFLNKPNDVYHSDDGFKSSSQLKVILNDPMKYYKKYITKELPKEEKDAFVIGNAWHCKILEPHLFDKEYTSYSGGIKRGEKWEKFKKANKGKTILGNKQLLEFDNLCKAVEKSTIVKPYLEGDHEVSVYVKLEGYDIKVRFDVLNKLQQFGCDPKSMQGNLIGIKGKYRCQQQIAGLDYDLSAALYMDAYNLLIEMINKQKGKEVYKPLTAWYWLFASKEFAHCRIFKATEKMLKNGRKKYKIAIELLKKYEASNWELKEFEEQVEEIDPLDSDLVIDDAGSIGVAIWT